MSPSKHMLFLMDACYSGLMTESVKGLEKSQDKGYLSKVANEKARQIITAGGRDEQVLERDEWQHSAFTKNLLAGLETWEADFNDDGYVTADELSSYLRETVTEDSDYQQTPQDGRFKNSGGGEFVFFGTGNKIGQDEILIQNKESLFSKIDFGMSNSGNWRYESRYRCNELYIGYNNIINHIDLLVGYDRCILNDDSYFTVYGKEDFTHDYNSISFDLRFNNVTNYKRWEKIVYYSAGIKIERADDINNLQQFDLGILPTVGYGFNFELVSLDIKIGYILYDFSSISNQYNCFNFQAGAQFNFFGAYEFIRNNP